MPSIEWLTDDEQRQWRAVLSVMLLLPDQLGRDLMHSEDLSLADYEILVRLSESADQRMRMSELASASLSSRSRLSHQVGRMEQAGLVRREECVNDRRGWLAVLTDAGLRRLEGAAPSHVDSVRRHLVDQLTAAEFAELGRICAKLGRRLQA